MKSLFCALLAAALLSGLAAEFKYAFRCYTCNPQGTDNNNECLVEETCMQQQICQTVVSSVNGKTSITKNCQSGCTQPTTGNVTSFVCCESNLCNINGATSVQVSVAALSLAVAASVYLLG